MMMKQQCALLVGKAALCLVLLFLLTGRSAAGRVSTALNTADVDNQALVENEGGDQQGLQDRRTTKVQLQLNKHSRDYLGPGHYPDPRYYPEEDRASSQAEDAELPLYRRRDYRTQEDQGFFYPVPMYPRPPPGPPGLQGVQGPPGVNGTDGKEGPAGPGACSSGRLYVSTSRGNTSTDACQAPYPNSASTCAVAKCAPGDAFLSGGCSTNDTANPVLTSSPLCVDSSQNATSCPASAATVAGWACASQTTQAASLTAQAVCCGKGFPPSVLIAAADLVDRLDDVQALLNDTGAFSKVDVFNAANSTPSVAQLQAYDAVLVWSNVAFTLGLNGFNDADAMGNNLADYRDAGGRVVAAVYATATLPLQGRWASGGYNLIDPTGQEEPEEADPLIINDPTSPLVAGVATLTAVQASRSTGGVVPGGVVVASWGSGALLIVRGVKDGRNLVALNFLPPSSRVNINFWNINTDGAAIMRNALLF